MAITATSLQRRMLEGPDTSRSRRRRSYRRARTATPAFPATALRSDELLEDPAERRALLGTAEAIAGLERAIDGAEHQRTLCVGLAALVGSEPGFHLRPAPQWVTR